MGLLTPKMPIVDVDLDAPAEERWVGLRPYAKRVRALTEHFDAPARGMVRSP